MGIASHGSKWAERALGKRFKIIRIRAHTRFDMQRNKLKEGVAE